MLIYYVSNALVLCWAALFSKMKPTERNKLTFVIVCFVQLFVISVSRYFIGHDYAMYYNGFQKMGAAGFGEISYIDWEWGFTLFTKFIAMFTDNYTIYLAIVAIICLAGPFWLIYRYSKKPWISVMLYINLYFFYCTMNFLRQSMALSIATFAWKFIKERKFIPFAMIITVAACFHVTVLIMIPVYFLVNFKGDIKTLLVYLSGIVLYFIFSDKILDFLLTYYHAEYRGTQFLEGVSSIFAVVPLLFTMIAVYNYDKIKESSGDNKILINMLYFSTFWMVVMTKHSIFERFSYYSYIYVLLLVPNFLESLSFEKSISWKGKSVSPRYATTIILIVVLLIYNSYGIHFGEEGVHGVFPYKTWLFG